MKENCVFILLQFLEDIWGTRIIASESTDQFYFTVINKEINKEGNTWRSTHSQELENSSSELLFSQMCMIYRDETSLGFWLACLSVLSCFDTLNLEATCLSPSLSPATSPNPGILPLIFILVCVSKEKQTLKKIRPETQSFIFTWNCEWLHLFKLQPLRREKYDRITGIFFCSFKTQMNSSDPWG